MTELTLLFEDLSSGGLPPGCALDLACGSGRHALWLAERGWEVTAVDLLPQQLNCDTFVQVDREQHTWQVTPAAWDLIVCWLYWQQDLLPAIARGVKPGGLVALAGKTSGRFATSLANYRAAFSGWTDLASGEDGSQAFFIAKAPAFAAR